MIFNFQISLFIYVKNKFFIQYYTFTHGFKLIEKNSQKHMINFYINQIIF